MKKCIALALFAALMLTTGSAFAQNLHESQHSAPSEESRSSAGVELGVSQSLGFFYTTTMLTGEYELIGPAHDELSGLTLDMTSGVGLELTEQFNLEATLGFEAGYKIAQPYNEMLNVHARMKAFTAGVYLNGTYNPTLQEQLFGSAPLTSRHLLSSNAGTFVDMGFHNDLVFTVSVGMEMRLWAHSTSYGSASEFRSAHTALQLSKRF